MQRRSSGLDMKLVIILIVIVFLIMWAGWIIVNPDGYRTFLMNHPEMDRTGTWSNASDTKLRVTGVVIIVLLIACGFALLKLTGLL